MIENLSLLTPSYSIQWKIISLSGYCSPTTCIMIDPNIIVLIYTFGFLLGIGLTIFHNWRVNKYGDENDDK